MTFLRWAGSKKQIGETLSNCWHAAQVAGGNGRYVEAFCGSATFFFRIKPTAARLVDINSDLIACFRSIQENPEAVARVLSRYPANEDFYYELRSKVPQSMPPIKAAARFIYLNRYCFNGLYRTNASGMFNVPYGGRRVGPMPNLCQLRDASRVLENATLVSGDFESALSGTIRAGDFIYLDPPYAKRNHSLDLQYGADVFGVNDLKRVFKLLDEIHEVGAYFVFSYADCEEVEPLVKRWNSCTLEVQRSIAADASRRGRTQELLVSNL